MSKLRVLLRNNLRKYRTERGLTQGHLAELADISLNSVNSIEAMRQWPSDTVIAKLCKVLEIEDEALFYTPRQISSETILLALAEQMGFDVYVKRKAT